MNNLKEITLAELAIQNVYAINVFEHFNLDYYNNRKMTLAQACKTKGVNATEVVAALKNLKYTAPSADFIHWPLDLLCDYIVKMYHREIRNVGSMMLERIDKACVKQGAEHPVFYEIQELLSISLQDLLHHIDKEEAVLFPYIQAIYEADIQKMPAPRFHCGSVANPIEVMGMEHDTEAQRFEGLRTLTGGFMAPEDADEDYVTLMTDLRKFYLDLHMHMHLENNLVFPRAIALERELMARYSMAY